MTLKKNTILISALFLVFSLSANADGINVYLNTPDVISINGLRNHNNESYKVQYKLFTCVLKPFNKIYSDGALTESKAKEKVSNKCQIGQGDSSIFCKKNDAICSESYILI